MKLLESQNESETISNRQLNLNKTRVAKGWKFGVAKFGKKSELISGIRKFKCNDKEICVSYLIQTIDGLVGIPVISINDIKCKKRINHNVLTSKVFRKIKTNKIFTIYVCLRLLKNLDLFLIREIVTYNSYN